MTTGFDVNAYIKGLQQLADLSNAALKSSIENSIKTTSASIDIINALTEASSGSQKKKKDDCGCCLPENECPPRCLITISRTAYAGERIIVPFKVKNSCNSSKTYRVGVRNLVDENGNTGPGQPQLNKSSITLEPGQSELVLMTIDLGNFTEGHSYETDIVLREKDINQNICFKLTIVPFFDIPEAKPKDEKVYTTHFQDWKSHFYCEHST